MIKVVEWTEAVEKIARGKLPVSHERTIGAGDLLPQGRIPDFDPQVYWKHPYFIQPVWNESIKLQGSEIQETGRTHGCWCLYVTPGFLNGHPPAIRMRRGDIPAGAQVWGNDYGKKPLGGGAFQSVLLTDQYRPFIKCTNMADTRSKVVGPPGCPGPIHNGEVPIYMRVRGAYKPDPLDFGDFLANLLNNADQEAVSRYFMRLINGEAPAFVQRPAAKDGLPEGNRLCYKADVFLQVDRPTVKQRFEYDDIGLLRYAGFDITLPPMSDYSARIYHTAIYQPPCQPTYWDIIFGTYIEYQYDEIVLATVYFMSPTEEFRNDGPPDGTWIPFVRHEVFWNLNYSSIQQIDVFTHDRSLEWFKGILSVLAGGVAYLFAVSVVNPIEASYDMVNTAFNQTAVKGQFWTG
jgi:hypothetical protein